ncbi:GDSL-type esterase/lipase family protein [Planotetraspora kaengkrachanensis]|uniref:Lipoprotein n=1 Tax=Planotetraspora kaengkrachanensis TaxID=575193 RepID=A0A8J3LWS9_9ACTN|nr:GDSL-type esterase/lipase family protein [Planotetraspora kaengkrachanensis]GIG80558.1 lipoprotein [Planotetraspora kaengkrachanensis]
MIKKLAAVVVASVLVGTGTAHARTSRQAMPRVMAALGDSISSGFNACGWYVSCTSRSWAAGDYSGVDSHYLRLLAVSPALRGHNLNFAVPGATSAELAAQARQAAAAGAEYVTILIGAQDACQDSEAAMTPVATYRQRIDAALAVLRPTGAHVFVASVPDLKRLWSVGRTSKWARAFWAIGRICPSMLANAGSADRRDEARRDRVRARVMAYNEQLRQACALYGTACRYDGGAVFSYPFTLNHLSAWDYFHPNADGQRALAGITYNAGLVPAAA